MPSPRQDGNARGDWADRVLRRHVAFCRTLVLIAIGAVLPAAGMLQAETVPPSPELPAGLTSRMRVLVRFPHPGAELR